MWKTTLSAAVFFGLSSLPVVVGLAVASENKICAVPQAAKAMDTTEAAKIGESLGYTITKIHLDDGCYELEGSDRNGASIELTVNPYSGKIMPETGAH